jgi:hypothetical protein
LRTQRVENSASFAGQSGTQDACRMMGFGWFCIDEQSRKGGVSFDKVLQAMRGRHDGRAASIHPGEQPFHLMKSKQWKRQTDS